jgi:hypothetical protein
MKREIKIRLPNSKSQIKATDYSQKHSLSEAKNMQHNAHTDRNVKAR